MEYYKKAITAGLHVRSIGLQLSPFPHVKFSPTNQEEVQEYLHPGVQSALEK